MHAQDIAIKLYFIFDEYFSDLCSQDAVHVVQPAKVRVCACIWLFKDCLQFKYT